MRTMHVAFTVMLLSFVAAPSSAGDRALGPMSITGDQTILLHFIGTGAAAARPFPITVRVFDSAGALVASPGSSCPDGQDVCPPTGSLLVDSTRVTSVSLSGAALGLAPDETMTIQPLVTSLSPGITHLLTTVEFFSANAADRVTVRFDPSVLKQQIPLQPGVMLGPLSLGPGELARFEIANYAPGKAAFDMFFTNASGAKIGTGKAVALSYRTGEMIELDGDAAGIAGVPGVIQAGTSEFRNGRLSATLEIIDKATGSLKTMLSNEGTSSGGGTGYGGGGGGDR